MNKVLTGDVLEMLKTLESESVQCCITSPPYWGLRDYGHNGQIGLEKTPEQYVEKMVNVFREVKRVLRKDGTLWLNLGDSYAGSMKGGRDKNPIYKQSTNIGSTSMPEVNIDENIKTKDLVGIPWRVAFALQKDGWWLRSDIIWAKPNPMPESVTDRPTKSHEYIFLLTKSSKYYYDADSIREPLTESTIERNEYARTAFGADGVRLGKGIRGNPERAKLVAGNPLGANKRSVWLISTENFSGAHFATFPEELPTICIKAGTKKGDIVLDPFAGSGTTLEVAKRMGREYIGIELNEKYVKELIHPRLENVNPLFNQ